MHRTSHPTEGEATGSESHSTAGEQESSPALSASSVPEATRARRQGTIEVVDVGTSETGLLKALQTQHKLARDHGQTVMVMLTGRRCRPCRGVDDALSDPLMQVALDGVRLVRIDLDVFREEIDELGMPRDIYPAFFLLEADGTARDTIHGGEWGEDVAVNIAPVLGAFVREQYAERRYQRAPTSRSLRL